MLDFVSAHREMGIRIWFLRGPCDWPITLNPLLLLDNMLTTFTLYFSERIIIEQLNKYNSKNDIS